MLNPFPGLFTYSFFAPTMLRLAVAAALFYIAYTLYANRRKIGEVVLPFVGKQPWAGTFSAVVHALLGFMLGAGYYTQTASLIAIAVTAKALFFSRQYPEFFPLSRGTYALLAIILCTLLLTGAGAFAYDLPL